MVDVSIIIISYNTKDMTLACLRSVYEQTMDISFEVIILDNGSGDGSAEAIEESFPEVNLIKSSENLGFAKANNKAAMGAKGNYLLLLNPDTVILDGAIQKLHQFALSVPDNRIYGGKTLFADHSLNPASCWRQQTLWGLVCYSFGLTSLFRKSPLFDPEGYGGWLRDCVREVDIVSGCFLLIDRALWVQLEGFEAAFFMYGEDADLCLRAKASGAKPIITPDAVIIHYGGASEKVRADKMVRLFRAKEDLLIHHWPPTKRTVGVFLFAVGAFARMVATRFLKVISKRRFAVAADNWQEIWDRRKEWHNV